jgi:hypothetical protein
VAYVELCLLDGALQRALSPQVLDDAPVAVRAEGARVGGHAPREQVADFLHQTRAEVRLGAQVDAAVELFARRVEREDAQARGLRRRRGALGESRRETVAGLQTQLQRALDARPVARVEARCPFGVEPAQETVQVFRAACITQGDEPSAQLGVGRRGLEEGLAERAQVEARAADE